MAYEKHSNKTRKRIVDSYIRLCCQKGIANVQLSELCEDCGIYRSTFYRYFDNLDALLIFIEDEFMNKSSQIKAEAMQYPGREYDRHLYEGLLKLFSQYREFLLALLSISGSPRFVYKYKRFLRENLIDQLGLRNLPVPVKVDLVLEYAVSGMVGSFSHLLRYSIQRNRPLDQDEEIWDFFMKTQNLPQVMLVMATSNGGEDLLSQLYPDRK